jgi:hypothetical protein
MILLDIQVELLTRLEFLFEWPHRCLWRVVVLVRACKKLRGWPKGWPLA